MRPIVLNVNESIVMHMFKYAHTFCYDNKKTKKNKVQALLEPTALKNSHHHAWKTFVSEKSHKYQLTISS